MRCGVWGVAVLLALCLSVSAGSVAKEVGNL
ncbi:hypothetical protein KIPB_012719, partial [Kipferlia bialata]|eukprot:g12719.t1